MSVQLLTTLKLRCRSLFCRRQTDEELDTELENHLDFEIQNNLESGLTEDEARRAALRSMENLLRVRERCRDVRGLNWLEDFCADTRYGLRSLWHNPGFAVTAVVILGLGIGSTTAVFSAVDRLLFRGMPYASPEQLVSLGFRLPTMHYEFMFAPAYRAWQRETGSFLRLGAWMGAAPCDLTERNPIRLNCALIDANLLPTLGVMPQLGRNFTSDEDGPNGARAVLISYAFWKGRFGGDQLVPGRLVNIDGAQSRVVGVLPQNFELPDLGQADIVMPQALNVADPGPGVPLHVIGRLSPDISLEQAKWRLRSLVTDFVAHAPAFLRSQVHFSLEPLVQIQTPSARRSSIMLFGSVWLVVIIACANVGGLLLARSASRQREIAVRIALGAGRMRLLRQALTESLVISALGGMLGLALTFILMGGFRRLAPSGIWVRDAASDLDRSLPFQVKTMQSDIHDLADRARLEAALLLFFGVTALLLAGVGTYGLIAFFVNQRVPEIGVRVALGARPNQIVALFLKQGLSMVLIGATAGLIGTALALRSVAGMLFDVPSFDPLVISAAVSVSVAAGLLATLIPARRASRVDALVALRQD
ncbi:MAG: ABC transporter permease [Acidobacteriaceae bacterium]|nr:ABC transporter permease [Acidobacteriaceae bacterium]